MEWTDDAIVIGARRHGESSVILEAMTATRGRHLGLVRGGRSSKLQPVLQAGNAVRLVWRARLEDHLGHFTVEGLTLRAGALIGNGPALAALAHLGALGRLLPEREPHPALHAALDAILSHFDDLPLAAALVARFELMLLADLGFGLDLAQCAASGTREDLIYVSPKTGRAVSRVAGEPWRDRLLPLPALLASDSVSQHPSHEELAQALRLTGHFLDRFLFEPRGMTQPESRSRFCDAVAKLARAPE